MRGEVAQLEIVGSRERSLCAPQTTLSCSFALPKQATRRRLGIHCNAMNKSHMVGQFIRAMRRRPPDVGASFCSFCRPDNDLTTPGIPHLTFDVPKTSTRLRGLQLLRQRPHLVIINSWVSPSPRSICSSPTLAGGIPMSVAIINTTTLATCKSWNGRCPQLSRRFYCHGFTTTKPAIDGRGVR